MNKNLLQETLNILYDSSLTEEDVEYVTNGQNIITWDCYKYLAKNINYKQDNNTLTPVGYGLKIVGKDWWIERNESGNLSWFEFKRLPNKANFTNGFFNPLLHDFSDEELNTQSLQYEQELILRALEKPHNTNINGTIKQQFNSLGETFYAVNLDPKNEILQQYLEKLNQYLKTKFTEFGQIVKNNPAYFQVTVFSSEETTFCQQNNPSFFAQINNTNVNLTLTHVTEKIQQVARTLQAEFSYHILAESKDIINFRRKTDLNDKELSMLASKFKNEAQTKPQETPNIILRKINIFEKTSTTKHKI